MAANKIKGLTIEIGGETTGLNKALGEVNKQTRDIQKELRDVDRLLKLDPKNTELIAQKQKLLGDAIDGTKEKLETLRDAEKQVQQQFQRGEVGEEQYRAIQREIVKAEQDLKNLDKKLKDTNDKWKDIGTGMKKVGDKMSDIGGKMTSRVTAPIVGGMTLAVESTRELREDMARLETNAQQAGAGVGEAEAALKNLNQISDETDSNIEALSNLMASGITGNALTQAVDDLSGAVIKFPDTLKIEGLADGLQETLATGKAIGPFAELLERSGVDIEAFNEGLAAAAETGDDTNYALQQLNNLGLSEVTKGYKESNEALIESKDAQFEFMQELSEIGATLEPVMTAIKEAVVGLMGAFTGLSPEMQNMILIALGVLAAVGPFLAILGPIISGLGGLTLAASTAGVGVAALVAPFAIAIAAIAAAIVIGIALYKNWDKIKETASAVFSSVKETISKVVTRIKEFFSDLVSSGAELITSFKEIGKNLVTGIWEGIKSMGSWIKEKVGGFFGGITDSVKGVLGIRSPSKVFESIGGFTGKGFAKGLESTKRAVEQSAATMSRSAAMGTLSGGYTNQMLHSGVIRHEGVNDRGELVASTETFMNEFRRELRV